MIPVDPTIIEAIVSLAGKSAFGAVVIIFGAIVFAVIGWVAKSGSKEAKDEKAIDAIDHGDAGAIGDVLRRRRKERSDR